MTQAGEAMLDTRLPAAGCRRLRHRIANRGVYQVDPEVEQRLEAGLLVSETEYYYGQSAGFDHAAEQAWLTSSVFVVKAMAEGDVVCIRFFRLR